ncbi:MAG: hypothetical protein JKY33_07760 [Bacteroidia bacterium]|nr:hypothetical protein [Bacteroidia bacterium]
MSKIKLMILLTLFTFGFIFQGCNKEDDVNVNDTESIYRVPLELTSQILLAVQVALVKDLR